MCIVDKTFKTLSQGKMRLEKNHKFTNFSIKGHIGGESSRNIIDNIADILFTLNKFYTEQLAKWLHDLLNKEGYPSTRVNNQDKEQFIKSLLR
jgi:hypothetical protein